MKSSKSLKFKLLTGGIMVVLIPLVIVAVVVFFQVSSVLDEQAREECEAVAVSLAGMLNIGMTEQLNIAKGIANDMSDLAQGYVQGDKDAAKLISRKLEAVAQAAPATYETIVFVVGGKVVADSSKGKTVGLDVSERSYWKAAMQGKADIGMVAKSKASGNPITVASIPVLSADKKPIAAIASIINVQYLTDELSHVKLGKTGYAFAAQKGLLIAHPKKEMILEFDISKQPEMEEFARKMNADKPGSAVYMFRGSKKLAGFAPVPLTGWSVGVTQDSDEVNEPVVRMRNYIVGITGVFLLVTIAAVWFFARSLTRPIFRVSSGLGEGAQQVAAASTQVASASQTLAEGTSEQAASIEETSSSLEEMSSMTKRNAESAGEARAIAQDAKGVAAKANSELSSLVEAMTNIGHSSEQTGKIIKTIDEIAFQTNLLALNAAVEAARAGEAGAGFAVVADEVRSLAMRAAEAAKNTSSLIENTLKAVRTGSGFTKSTQEAFALTQEKVNNIMQLVDEIAAASSEQAQGIEQINKAVTEMEKVVQRNAASAEESASASEELNAQAAQMKGYVAELLSVIGGNRRDAAESEREVEEEKPAPAARTARKFLASAKPKALEPEEVIPFKEDSDFKNF